MNYLLSLSLLIVTPAVLATAPSDQILIQGKDVSVTRADYELELLNIPDEHRLGFTMDQGRVQRLLEKILVNKTLAHRARALEFDKQPTVIAQLNYSAQAKLAALFMADQRSSIKPPNLELRAKEMFEKNANKYAAPEQVRASHLLVSARIRSRDEAEAKAKQLRDRLIAGEDFGALVKAHTDDDGTREKQGDLGFFTAEQMVPAFSRAAFALKQPGELSPLVESQFGFHIIRFAERKPKTPALYETHRKELLSQAESEYVESNFRVQLEKIIKAQDPKPNQSAIQDLRPKVDFDALLKAANPSHNPSPKSQN